MKKTFSILFVIALLWSCKSDKSSTETNEATVKETPKTETVSAAPVKTEDEKTSEADDSKTEIEATKEVEKPVEKVEKPKNKAQEQKPKSKKSEPVEEVAETEKVEIEKPAGHPYFKNAVFSMDTLEAGDVVEHRFYFTNTGEAPLNVMKVDVTCGCTVPSFPIVPILPGDEGFIGVTYNSVGKKGKVRPKITIITDGTPKEVDLFLDGFVLEKTEK